MRKLYLLANIALLAPVAIYLLSLVLQQFTNTVWWYLRVWDPIANAMLEYAFLGLPFIALAFVFSTPYMGLFSRIVKGLIVLCCVAFVLLHVLYLIQLGTLFPSDFGAAMTGFLYLMVAGPILFFGSLWLTSVAALKHQRNKAPGASISSV